MKKKGNYKLSFLVILILFFLNITGCATHSVWEKSPHYDVIKNSKTKATAYGFYENCPNIEAFQSNKIIPFKVNNNKNEFPPFNEGYLVIAWDDKTGYLINRINGLQKSAKNSSQPTFQINANILRTTDPENNIKYFSSYKFFYKIKDITVHDPYAGSSLESIAPNAKGLDIKFINKIENGILNFNCISLTNSPVQFDITFTQGSLRYNEYKNSLGSRIILTPFSVAIDAITFPIQLILGYTLAMWGPT